MPKVGLEPTLTCVNRILSPARLPFRHFGSGITLFQDRAGVSPGQVQRRLTHSANAIVPPSCGKADGKQTGPTIQMGFVARGYFDREVQHRDRKA